MGDVDTFLTLLYGMADDFCKSQAPPDCTPGLKASLSVSEVITPGYLQPVGTLPQ